jgi:hypothetical protein
MKPKPTPMTCPTCGKRLKISPSAAGKTVQCPECLEDLPISKSLPAAVPAPPPAPPPPPPADAGNPFDFDFDSDSSPEPSSGDEPPAPHFTAIEVRAWTPNRTYRIYVRKKQRELVAIYAGLAGDAGMAGLVAIEEPGQRRRAKSQAIEESKALEKWCNSHPFNFLLSTEDVESAEVAKPSFWFTLNNHTVPRIGLLRLYTTEGKRTLALATVEDVRRMLELLPPLLDDRIEVGLVWDKARRRYVSE